jgi:hypothetical protein
VFAEVVDGNRGVARGAPVGAGPMDFGKDSDTDLRANALDLGDDDPKVFVSRSPAGSDK